MAQQAPFSSPFTNTYSYDVFLSFRGEDTRIGFTGNLYSALCQRGVLTFIDDDGLRKGEEITPSLLKAIQKSRMAIIIFSRNYASSTFCLNELVEILECTKEKGGWIWPIFYDVDPSEVRHQKGTFGEALTKHELGRFKDDIDKVQKWRLALQQAAELSGWHFKQQGGEYEHVFIRRVIEEITHKLNRPLLHVAKYPVGLESRVLKVESLVDIDFNNKVNILGIYGIGGIGKSTVARAVYNLIANQFEGSCFVASVREKSARHGLTHIQETLLSELVGETSIKLVDMNQGIPILKERLHRKRVLVILDDVDKSGQLQATTGGLDWFGLGSIIIITTRNKHLLDIHGVEKLYEVNKLNDTEALELLRWNAFKNNEVDPSYMEIIKHAIYYAGGLPLALETIGSNLFGKTLDEWKSALEAYKRIPNRDVQETLRVSYDGLEENEQEIFLDIACFFKGCNVRYVTSMLHARGFQAKYGIRVLEEKSLIKIMKLGARDGNITVTMHDLIQHMGKEIVRKQSTWPDKRNRLWFHDDVIRVLEKNKENYEIEAMMLDMPEDKEVQWDQEVFGKMKNLRMLIKKNAGFFKSPKHLPNSLRVLEWWRYPSATLPSNFLSKNLVTLNLSYSCFQWEKPLEKSKFLSQLIFTGCKYIKQIPDVSGLQNLTELCVDYCKNLIEIHDSVGFLDKLQRFSAKGCSKLRIIPRCIKLTSLEYLCLRDCSSLNIFPEILGPMEKLQFLDFEGTAIENLPLSMQNLKGIQTLSLSRCTLLNTNALSNIVQMLPNLFSFMETLMLDGTNLTILPACIKECHSLTYLGLKNCTQLQEIRGLPPNLLALLAYNCTSLDYSSSTLDMLQNQAMHNTARLRGYFLPGQRIPEWFDHSCRGNSVNFWFLKEFPAIIVCAVLGVEGIKQPVYMKFEFLVEVNGTAIRLGFYHQATFETDHAYMCNNIPRFLELYPVRQLLKQGWNHVVVSCVIHSDCLGSVTWTGVHINREVTSMEDVRFTNPYALERTFDQSYYSNIHSAESEWTTDSISDLDEATLSSGDLRGELHLGTNSTMMPATTDESLKNQNEPSQYDIEMEAFYASLDAAAHVLSFSHDKSTTNSSSEETREALKIVQDFFSNDASILLHHELCSVMKNNFDYLYNLSADDDIQGEMKTLISDASRKLTHWSRDYIEASNKIESTASGLQRADELKEGMEANKNLFKEVVALQNELLQKLARMEKNKKELEEQINAIKANITAFELEKNMAHERMIDIFEKGKILKTQMDELTEKVPHLQHEQGLAKKIQAKITAEWSKLGEKFKIAVDNEM